MHCSANGNCNDFLLRQDVESPSVAPWPQSNFLARHMSAYWHLKEVRPAESTKKRRQGRKPLPSSALESQDATSLTYTLSGRSPADTLLRSGPSRARFV